LGTENSELIQGLGEAQQYIKGIVTRPKMNSVSLPANVFDIRSMNNHVINVLNVNPDTFKGLSKDFLVPIAIDESSVTQFPGTLTAGAAALEDEAGWTSPSSEAWANQGWDQDFDNPRPTWDSPGHMSLRRRFITVLRRLFCFWAW